MTRSELYHKTVDILTAAYFNDTLERGNCYACAVGNLVAYNMGIKPIRAKKSDCGKSVYWRGYNPYGGGNITARPVAEWFSLLRCDEKDKSGRGLEQIKSTGYTIRELDRIELAFESAEWSDDADERMFNGLMAVIDVLDEIHENKDTAITEKSKKSFVKPSLCQS